MERLSDSLRGSLPRMHASADAPARRRPLLGRQQMNCPRHGVFMSEGYGVFSTTRPIWTHCPACEAQDKADQARRDAEEAARRKRAELESAIGQAHIPARFVGRTLDGFKASTKEQQHALETARDFLGRFDVHAKRGTTLVFSGSPGTGKSHLATAILQGLMPERVGLYLTCMSLIRAIRNTWRRDSERSESQVLAVLRDTPLLVLDEIGVQYGTEGEQTILFDVLDLRYREMMPTVLLTNQNRAGLKEFLGERSFDRLIETAKWVPFDWPSYRAQARQEWQS